MLRNSNFHSHCLFCDGHGHPETFLRFAIAGKFRAYGYSSHSPLPFETFWNMSKDDLPEYIDEINRLKRKYAGTIEIYTGLEIDYLGESFNAATDYFQSMPLDYRISAIHFLPWREDMPLREDHMTAIDGSYEAFRRGIDDNYRGSIRRLTEHFFRSSVEMINAGGFDVVGHIDKLYMNAIRHPDFDIHAEWYRKPFLGLLDRVAEKGLIVEVNCKNKTGRGQTYPHVEAYGELRERGIPVMVNSDCHHPDRINDGRPETLALLKNAGYRTVRELAGGVWTDMEI